MKAAAVEYRRATSVQQALAELARPDAKVLAGGQSLVPMLNLRLAAPSVLVDITPISEMRRIEVAGTTLRLGALVRHADILASADVARHAPLLVQAVRHVAHAAIRNRGTIGGSLAHADPAAELPACALALGARIGITGPAGRRVVPAESFFTGLFQTVLEPTELLTDIEIDIAAPDHVHGFQELVRRAGDYAMVGLAAQGRLRDGDFQSLRLGWFSVGSRPLLAPRAAAAVIQGDMDAAEAALADDLPPHDDNQADAATRMRLAQVMLRRVIKEMRA